MKKTFTILFLMMSLGLCAQTYNNEWIDFSKTYYKFKVGADGLYRIPQSVLAGAGLGATPAEYFQLFRNGQPVPIYTSVASGTLGASGYIEFWGQMNDGKPDKPLYRNPAYQHTDKWSLQTDTAVYFLTVNPAGGNLRYNDVNNDPSSTSLPVEPYFMYKSGTYFKTQLNNGFAQNVVENIYSSSYDIGEFWSSGPIYKGTPFTDNQNNLFVYTGGPDASIKFGAAGNADTLRKVQLRVNNTLISETEMDGFNDLVSSSPLPLSLINSSSAAVQFTNNSQATVISDRIVVSYYEITYPRQFNFNSQSNFYFELPAKVSGYFLKISNFNSGGQTPVLYDLATRERYTAVVDAGNMLNFVLTGSAADRKLVLVSEDPSNIKTVTGLTSKNFLNFNTPANQGNYIIISNPTLYTGSSGNNPVLDYKNYRSSAAGGGFNTQVVDINELVDQFSFGIKKHPLSVKNFLNYARNYYASKPEFVFIIGRGMAYNDYRLNESGAGVETLNPVPTFGFPASDQMLSSGDGAHSVALTPIGRLAAINGPEVEIYLQKVKEYEQAQQTAPNTLAGREWMKTVIHVTGATDPYLEAILCSYMSGYRQIIADTLFGGDVTTLCSSSIDPNDQSSSQLFPQLFSSGINMLTYFGHSSAANLGFNLDDPSIYNNQGKYPVFYVNGCYAGNFYTYDQGRLALGKTLSENYVLAKEKGSIAFVASSHYGVVSYLGVMINGLYNLIAKTDYGESIGKIQTDAAQSLLNVLPTDFLARTHAEEMNIHGDPALKINTLKLPDYVVEASQVKITPAFISISNNSFTVNARFVNLGKAVSDSVSILVTRKYPNGSSEVLLQKKIPGIRYEDSIQVSVPIIATRDKGQNYITITINPSNEIPEVTYINNSVTTGVYIYQDELTPVYPYNYAIINIPTQKLYASTANPFAGSTQYVMEMDTTELFNSAAKISKNITSIGGVLEFDPGITYRDSTVYYWRTSIVPPSGGQYHWNEFSFVYIDSAKSSVGFNQSHYYQHAASSEKNMFLNAASRSWLFDTLFNDVYIRNTIYPTGSGIQSSFTITINGATYVGPGCNYGEIIYNVIDPVTFKVWKNDFSGPTGLYNSLKLTCGSQREYNFDYLFTDSASRKKSMDFLDLIPNGYYVTGRFNVDPVNNVYVDKWKADTSRYGSNNSLYHKLMAAGITIIDSFTRPRAIAFIYKKGDPSFTPQYTITQGITDQTFISTQCKSPAMSGSMTSPVFGPAKQWKELHWRGTSTETTSTDSVGVQVIGVDSAGNQTPLYDVDINNQDYDISTINATQYPYLQLKMTTADTVHATPYQLRYWRLNYVPVPEGALAANLFLSIKDTVELGEKIPFGIAFKNVSRSAFDSMRIKLNIIDKNNVTHTIVLPKMRPIVSGDTLKIMYEIDSKDYAGLNTIYLDVNPDNAQPEQYHFNNFLYHNFLVKVDETNPLLDVTFDNVHILNEDIVSAKPHIQIKLTDEAKFLLLNDTSLFKVQLRYPDGSLHPYYFNSDTLRFTPATSSADNTASVDFYPAFTKQINPEGDTYQLIVTGKDKSGNSSGTVQYQVSFKIITKAMISNMLNYPNPFTTSTAFVFTITGSEVPQNIKIQILTITGKIVREITKDELGPLHVGRNITEFKWDGTDMYHQRLANGVYLYHVVTNLNGKSLDKYRAQGDNTDQYFNKGYGKMYLMR